MVTTDATIVGDLVKRMVAVSIGLSMAHLDGLPVSALHHFQFHQAIARPTS